MNGLFCATCIAIGYPCFLTVTWIPAKREIFMSIAQCKNKEKIL